MQLQKIFLLLFLFNINIYAFVAQDVTDKISNAIAVNLYNIEPDIAKEYASLMVEKYKEDIVALEITDAIDNSVIYKYDNDNLFELSTKNPQKAKNYKIHTKKIFYEDEYVGNIILYYRNKITFTLTHEEEEWIKKHPVIQVGGEQAWAPYSFVDVNGHYTGISRDYLDRIAKKSGLKFQYHTDRSWSELLVALKDGKIDIIPALYRTKDREKYTNFTQSYLELQEYFFTKAKHKKITSIKELEGKTIALIKDYAIVAWIKEKYPEIHVIEKKDMIACLEALESGESEAFIGTDAALYTIEKNFFSGIILNNTLKEKKPAKLYMGTKKEFTLLRDIINKIFQTISKKEHKEIVSEWVYALNSKSIKLNEAEQNYLKNTKPVHYVYDPKWKPFEWRDDIGEHQGIISDLLKLITHNSGLEFTPVESLSWTEAIENVKSKKALMFSGIGETQDRKNYLNFSKKPLLTTPFVFVTKQNKSYLNGFDDVKDKKVAVVINYTIDGILKAKRPDLKLIRVKSVEEGFKKLEDGEIDLFIVNAITAKYYQAVLKNNGIFISYKTKYNLEIKIAIRKDAPKEILEIVNKSIDLISPKEVNDIIYKWTKVQITWKAYLPEIIEAFIVVLLIILFIMWNNKKLSILVKEKTADLEELSRALEQKVEEQTKDLKRQLRLVKIAERKQIELFKEVQRQEEFVQTLLDSQEQLIITTDGKKLITANRTFYDFFTVDSIKEFQETYNSSCIGYTFNTKAPQGYLQLKMGEDAQELWIDYVIARPFERAHKVMISRGDKDFIFSVTVARLPGDTISAVLTDITEMENAKIEIEAIHKHTRESIEYASLIQSTLIPDNQLFKNNFQDYFAIWHPKDIVGGDIYLFEELREKDECLLMVIDCTGHGVPGAFVSMLVKAIERQVVSKINYSNELVSPAKILGIFNKNMKQLLKQESMDSISNAGFDGGVLYYNKREKILKYAGAETPLFIVEDDKLSMIKGDRYSVGYKKCAIDYEYAEHTIEPKEGMQFYLTTDGYLDQNGGEKGFPFGKKRFKSIIEKYHKESMADQKEIFLNELDSYQDEEERNDDVTLVGFKI